MLIAAGAGAVVALTSVSIMSLTCTGCFPSRSIPLTGPSFEFAFVFDIFLIENCLHGCLELSFTGISEPRAHANEVLLLTGL